MGEKYFKELEKIIRDNLDKRGLDKVNFPGELKMAAADLLNGSTILIATGFVIRDALSGETDGPIGAVSLAGALEELGKKVVLVTDKYSQKALQNCCSVRGIKGPVENVPYESTREFCWKLIEKYRPTHVAAIERPGRAKDGRCYSMRGEDLSDIVPNTDLLFEFSKKLGITTLAVGDGGNEVGMGKAAFYIVNNVNMGYKICAAFSSDYLIASGVSNWGGHALCSALSLISNKMLLHDETIEIRLMKALIDGGAVDGCTKKRELTVDGLSLEKNLSVLRRLRSVLNRALEGKSESWSHFI